MKKYYSFLLLFTLVGFSQFTPSAPWSSDESAKQQKSLDQLVNEFNDYWKNHDKNIKASGYKPFMRWEYRWRNLTNEQGYIITPGEFFSIWNEKKNSVTNKNGLQAPPSNWQAVGPFTHTNTGSWSSGQGRVNFIVEDPNNSSTIYLGAPAGGIWKSTDSGVNWSPLSDELPQIGVSGIAVDHTNSNIIYIATGDKDAADTYSIGVLKSVDGGVTWNTTGLTFNNTFSRSGDLMMHPTNNQILLCATSSGLYKTTDAGLTWNVVQSGDFSQGSVRFKPNDPSVIYAVSSNRFYRSTNTGTSFTQITSNLPTSSSRMVMDVTPANAQYVYILCADGSNAFQGVFRSVDGGTTFNPRNQSTDVFEGTQSWYDLALGVSSTNAEEIFTGCLNVWKSTNGGTTLTKLNNWSSPNSNSYTHADIHFLRFYGNRLYCGSDGGIYVSTNSGTNFNDLTATAQISQYYKIAVSKQSSSKMVGGLQDNGGYAYSGGQWKNYYGADGMDTAIDPNNSNLYYGFIQGGGTLYISNDAGNSLTSNVGAPSGQNGNWVTPLISNGAGQIFAGYGALFRLNGSAWVQQNTGSLGSGSIDEIEVDPSNDDIMYVANGSTLYKSVNHGVNFSSVYNAPGSITSIEVHSDNSNIVYLTTSGTSGQALKSTNGGTSFTDISTGLPSLGKNVIVHQGENPNNPLYVGTSLGVYYRDDTMTSWEPFETNLPNVSVTDLEINLVDKKIVAATYGRGIWMSDIPTQLASNDIKLNAVNNPTANIGCDTNLTPEVVIENNGVNNITTANIAYSIDGGATNNYTWNGTLTTGQTATVTLPSTTLTRGIHTFDTTVTITNDAYSNNNSSSVTAYINDSGTVGVVNGFTNTTDALMSYNTGSTSSQWTRGIRTGGAMDSGAGNYVYTTNLSGNYPDKIKSFLVSQCYDLTNVSNPQIHFDMKYDLEENWDIVYVEYTTDFGANWSVLGTMGANWYNSDRTEQTAGNDCYNCPGAQWTGTNTTNTNYFYSLNTLIGQPNVIFRIVFHSDDSVNQLGVNIDNFVITGTLPNEEFNGNQFSIYPNPTSGIISISFEEITEMNIQVFDLTGKIVHSVNEKPLSTSIDLDISSFSKGIYFIKIDSGGNSVTKRIIKN